MCGCGGAAGCRSAGIENLFAQPCEGEAAPGGPRTGTSSNTSGHHKQTGRDGTSFGLSRWMGSLCAVRVVGIGGFRPLEDRQRDRAIFLRIGITSIIQARKRNHPRQKKKREKKENRRNCFFQSGAMGNGQRGKSPSLGLKEKGPVPSSADSPPDPVRRCASSSRGRKKVRGSDAVRSLHFEAVQVRPRSKTFNPGTVVFPKGALRVEGLEPFDVQQRRPSFLGPRGPPCSGPGPPSK